MRIDLPISEANQASPMAAVLSDPIGAIAHGTRELNQTTDDRFAEVWLKRAILTDLLRFSFEDDTADINSDEYRAALRRLDELLSGSTWIVPELREMLLALRRAINGPAAPVRIGVKRFESVDGPIDLIGYTSTSGQPMRVSSSESDFIPILEFNLADPVRCGKIINWFARTLAKLKGELGIDHLCFIEKELGPVGAIPMMATLVRETGLPAFIVREPYWSDRSGISAGSPLSKNARVAVVYDLIVSGGGISNAAGLIKEQAGANTLAATSLFCFGEKRDQFDAIAEIPIDTYVWEKSRAQPSAHEQAFRAPIEPRNGSEARRDPRNMRSSSDDPMEQIPAGSYTHANFPPLTDSARQLGAEIAEFARKHADKFRSLSAQRRNTSSSSMNRLAVVKNSGKQKLPVD